VDEVNREDLWREAAQALGVKNIPNNTSRGTERFFDGVVFDPQDPQAYLNSLKNQKGLISTPANTDASLAQQGSWPYLWDPTRSKKSCAELSAQTMES
jgi:hypothetical protein